MINYITRKGMATALPKDEQIASIANGKRATESWKTLMWKWWNWCARTILLGCANRVFRHQCCMSVSHLPSLDDWKFTWSTHQTLKLAANWWKKKRIIYTGIVIEWCVDHIINFSSTRVDWVLLSLHRQPKTIRYLLRQNKQRIESPEKLYNDSRQHQSIGQHIRYKSLPYISVCIHGQSQYSRSAHTHAHSKRWMNFTFYLHLANNPIHSK